MNKPVWIEHLDHNNMKIYLSSAIAHGEGTSRIRDETPQMGDAAAEVGEDMPKVGDENPLRYVRVAEHTILNQRLNARQLRA